MKIVIVGAGLIGCYIARLLKERSSALEIKIIEEHSELGKPVHCAGLVGKTVISETKVSLDAGVVLNRIDGAEFFLDGDSFKMKRKDVALVVDREKFDRAIGNNLNIDFNTKFMGIEKEGSGYLVETDKGEHYADIVIGADGANSLMRQIIGFGRNKIECLRGVQYRMRYDRYDENFVQVFIKNPTFAWIIPEGDSIVRVGIISDNPYYDLTEFLKDMSIEGEILEKFGGVVSFGRCVTRKDNLILVGDAACQVKPLTYGGIYYGMRCAEILADCIINNRLPDYEKQWQARFGREIEIGLKMRQIYRQLSFDSIKKLFSFLKENVDVLEQLGDFENHSKIITAVIRNPSLQNLLGKVLVSFLKDIPLNL